MKTPSPSVVNWMIAALLVTVIPHLRYLPLWFIALLALVCGSRLAAAHWRWRPFPAWLRLVVTVATFISIAFSYGSVFGRHPGTALLAAMLTLKLLESFRYRDVFVVASLCYFLIVAQFLFSQSPLLVSYLLVAFVLVTVLLVVLVEDQAESAGQTLTKAPLAAGKHTSKLIAQALPLAAVFFFFFPRLSSPIWGLPEDALDGKTGLSGKMAPGSITELLIDDSPAFRVEFEGSVPAQQDLYFRGPVLWKFDGRQWSESYLMSAARTDPVRESGTAVRYNLMLEPHHRRWIFALDYPGSVPSQALLNQNFVLQARKSIVDRESYDLVSYPDGRINTRLLAQQRQAGLQLPPNRNPRTAALAQQWREELPSDQAIAQRALSMFNAEPFAYSFSPPPLGFHSADDFLFDTREGYCEHYASAFTLLMRAAGIPARVVTGYQGGFYNEAGNYLLVRQSDAHAWAEIWLEGRGWIRVDPTAAVAPERIDLGARRAAGARRSLLDYDWLYDLQGSLDTITNFWNRWVLQFDRERQRTLLQPFGVDDLDLSTTAWIMAALFTLFLLSSGFWVLRRQGRSSDLVQREYERFCRKLRPRGLVRGTSEGPGEFADRCGGELPQARPAIDSITHLYIKLRYGPAGSASDFDALQTQVKLFQPA